MIAKRTALSSLRACAALLLFAGCATQGTGGKPAAPAVRQLAKATTSWNGAALPQYPAGQPEVTLLEITIPPGARLATHRHPVINAGVMLSGALTVVTASGQTLRLAAGDPIIEVVDTLHYGRNEGTTPAKLIVFYAGVEGTPISVVENGNAPPANGGGPGGH